LQPYLTLGPIAEHPPPNCLGLRDFFAVLAVSWLAISYFTWSLVRMKRGYALLTG